MMYLRRDCLGLRSKKAGKAEQNSKEAEKQRSKEAGKAEKQRLSREKQRSRKAEILERCKQAKKQGAEKQRSRETDIQEKIPKQKKHIKHKYSNHPFHFGASSISLSLFLPIFGLIMADP